MDDIKDYEKDKIVHPDRYEYYSYQHWCRNCPLTRPLPRGLIRYEEVLQAINYTLIFLVVYAVLLGLRYNWTVGALFGVEVSTQCGVDEQYQWFFRLAIPFSCI